MSETSTDRAVGAKLANIACPACGKIVPVECGDVTGLGLETMIAAAMAKADRAHVTFDAVDHEPVSVSKDDAGDAAAYREAAIALLDRWFPPVSMTFDMRPRRPLVAEQPAAANTIPIRRRPPEEARRRLRASDLPRGLITAHPACASIEAREIRDRRANARGGSCPSCGAGILGLPPGHGLAIHGTGAGPWSAECRDGAPVCLTRTPGSGYAIEAWEAVAAVTFHDDFRRHEAQALKAILGDGPGEFTGLLGVLSGNEA